MIHGVKLFLRDIRIEHTLFALPFAYTGAVLAARGIPSWHALMWITLAVLGARTAAMAANRYFDRDLDARIPRTAQRALASGALPAGVMLWAIVVGIALLLVAAWQLNPLCVKLLPIAAIGLLGYPLCKRFTWMTHFVLGAVDGLAPLGAWIGIAGSASLPPLLLFLGVTLWVAGFDVLYALMDLPFDREHGVQSLPVRFGEGSARRLPLALHLGMLLLLATIGFTMHLAPIYFMGILFAGMLIDYERRIIAQSRDVFALNDRIFTANMGFSVLFLGSSIAGFLA